MSPINDLIEAIKQGNLPQVQTLLQANPDLANQFDESGATPLHYAAFHAHQQIVKLLIEHGAGVNNTDKEFAATPTGWAIEYLRELGGHLSIELEDLSYAIKEGDIKWIKRFLQRFPNLKNARDKIGKPFKKLAAESGNPEIIALFQ